VTRFSDAIDTLDGIDLVVFDKDGTLLDFHAMWGGWAIELGRRLDGATRRPVAGDVFATIGFDPATGRARPGSPLVVGTMGQIRELTAAVIRRWCPSVGAARQAVETAWFTPDPVTTVIPIGDPPGLFAALRESGRSVAVATTDDRAPTDATLRVLGVRDLVSAIACGDDGIGIKPDPRMLLGLCEATGIPPDRTAVVGDTLADLRMARSAGARLAIGVLSGVDDAEALGPLADLLLPSIADLRIA
jgi:phosphoglycolate phosphatase-like HAD superfamily hydrolase